MSCVTLEVCSAKTLLSEEVRKEVKPSRRMRGVGSRSSDAVEESGFGVVEVEVEGEEEGSGVAGGEGRVAYRAWSFEISASERVDWGRGTKQRYKICQLRSRRGR